MTSFFVTGTDTEVGKTRISVALIELLQQQGKQVAVMKPIASGCELTDDGLRNDDAVQLSQQADVSLAYELINPYAFEPAIAPHIAAKQADENIDLALIKQNFDLIQSQAESVVVEGAGGWLVPLNDHATMADLAVELSLPVILVVGIRLGCINHARLTYQMIESSGVKCAGWLAMCVEPDMLKIEDNISTIKQAIDAPLLGVLPYSKEADFKFLAENISFI